jgi:thiol-disulfide isomerase/thioredoxin
MFYNLNFDNKKRINNLILSEDNVTILYYSTMCGYCIQLKPTWHKLCNSIKNNNKITIINVESNNIKYLRAKYKKNIMGYPTIVKFSKGKKIEEYSGNRIYNDMKKFVK